MLRDCFRERMNPFASCVESPVSPLLESKNPVRAPDSSILDANVRTEIADTVHGAVSRAQMLDGFVHMSLEDLDELDRMLLVERHLISRQHAEGSGARRVSFDPSEIASVMVNEEDHLRIQVMRSGLQLDEAWE